MINIPKQKMVKVKFVGGSTLAIGAKRYKRGDVLEIPERLLIACPDLYMKVEKAKPKKKTTMVATPKVIEEATSTLTVEEKKIVDELVSTDTTTEAGKKKAKRISDRAEKTKK